MPASRKEVYNGKYIDDQMANGIPEGGSTGQVLAKASDADYDTEWVTGGGGSGVTSVTATAPLSSTGGTTPDISISQADTTTDGYLSSTDWNTFNDKLGTIPTLQQVTDQPSGNTTTNDIIANQFTSGVPLSTPSGTLGMTAISLSEPTASWEVALIDNSLSFGDLSGTYNKIKPPATITNGISTLPNTTGYLANSVNGVAALADGSITIPVGTGTVTSVGAGTGTNFTAFTVSGNIDIDTAKVPYYASVPSNGLLKYTSGTWGVDTNTYLTTISGITAGGDLQGTYPNPTVHQIQGQSVQNGAPTNQDLLIWDNSASMWKHQQISTITGYNNTNWDTAYTNRITSLTTTGSSGSATLSSNTLNVPTYTLSGLGGQPLATNLTSLAGLSYASASFVKMTAAGAFSLDTNTYLTSVGTGTTNELTYWSGANTLGSLTTATYPSLTELSYVKGVTSGIQTQITGKQTDSAWVDCSSNSISGWASTTTKLMQYKLLGSKTMIFQFSIVGTGTSGGTASITLPFTSSTWGEQTNIIRSRTTATLGIGISTVAASSTTLNLYPSAAMSTWNINAQRDAHGTIIINLA